VLSDLDVKLFSLLDEVVDLLNENFFEVIMFVQLLAMLSWDILQEVESVQGHLGHVWAHVFSVDACSLQLFDERVIKAIEGICNRGRL
jgi:hypothetical protein